MSKFNFTYKSLYKIAADLVGENLDDELSKSHILVRWPAIFHPSNLMEILTKTQYLNETELSVLYYFYVENKSYRSIAELVGYSHTKVGQLLYDVICRLHWIDEFFTSDSCHEVSCVDNLVDSKLDYDRDLTDLINIHDIEAIYLKKVWPESRLIDFLKDNSEQFDSKELESKKDEIERRLGLKHDLSEEFIKYTIDFVVKRHNDLIDLELLNSPSSDTLDFELSIDDVYRSGFGKLILSLIDLLETAFSKSVNIILNTERSEA